MMRFYQLVGCGILVHLVVVLPLNAVTQPSPDVCCHQLSPVPRPKGEAVLVCDVFGIKSDEMELYWWIDVAKSTDIYIYSDSYKVDEVKSTYRDMVVNETHVISKDHIKSEIKLLINMTSNDVFKFEIKMASSQAYTDEVKIAFEDPPIAINLEEMWSNSSETTISTIRLVTICHVVACFGKPIMSITYNDIEGEADNEIEINGQFYQDDPTGYFNGIHHVVIKTRNCHQIHCSVTDERGTYHATRNITLCAPEEDNFEDTATSPSDACKTLLLYIHPGVFGIAIIMGVAACIYSRRCRNINVYRRNPSKEDRQQKDESGGILLKEKESDNQSTTGITNNTKYQRLPSTIDIVCHGPLLSPDENESDNQSKTGITNNTLIQRYPSNEEE